MSAHMQPKHAPKPRLIEMFHRYQCDTCKRWTGYSEETGKWTCDRELNSVESVRLGREQ